MNTKVSIIIVTYNHSKYLEDTIKSVQNQSYKNWEIILINNGSTDNTLEIASKIYNHDKRIKIVDEKNNKSIAARLNQGLSLASGEYIATLDSDDLWIDKNKLKTQVEFLNKNPDYNLVGTWVRAIDLEGNTLFNIVYPYQNTDIKNNMLKHNCILHSSSMMRKSVVDKIGGYNVKKFYAVDYCMALRIGMFGKIYNIPQIMVGYRLNPGGLSQTKYQTQIKETIKTIWEYKTKYPNFLINYTLWNLRRYYPAWFRYGLPRLVGKNIIS